MLQKLTEEIAECCRHCKPLPRTGETGAL